MPPKGRGRAKKEDLTATASAKKPAPAPEPERSTRSRRAKKEDAPKEVEVPKQKRGSKLSEPELEVESQVSVDVKVPTNKRDRNSRATSKKQQTEIATVPTPTVAGEKEGKKQQNQKEKEPEPAEDIVDEPVAKKRRGRGNVVVPNEGNIKNKAIAEEKSEVTSEQMSAEDNGNGMDVVTTDPSSVKNSNIIIADTEKILTPSKLESENENLTRSTSITHLPKYHEPSIKEMKDDRLVHIASKLWAPGTECGPFDFDVVKEIFEAELHGNKIPSKILDFSGYLENYLWKHYTEERKGIYELILSIIVLVNEKFKETDYGADVIISNPEKFKMFFEQIVVLGYSGKLRFEDSSMTAYVVILINLFRSLEISTIREAVLSYLSLPIWEALSPQRLESELQTRPQMRRYLNERRKSDDSGGSGPDYHSIWIPCLYSNFLSIMDSLNSSNDHVASSVVKYLERFAEFTIDLLSQIPTRRFLRTLLDDYQLIVKCRMCSFVKTASESRVFNQLLDMIERFLFFEVDDFSGQALTSDEIAGLQNAKLHKLQTLAYVDHKNSLKELIYSSTGALGSPKTLLKHLEFLKVTELAELAKKVRIVSDRDIQLFGETSDENIQLQEYLLDCFAIQFKFRRSVLESINASPLHPSEQLLWDEGMIPAHNEYKGDKPLPLPKLNLQYLTIHDYLLRNFIIYRLESAYEIRESLEDAIKRMGPRESLDGRVGFSGWCRMASQIHNSQINIYEVGKPNLGEVIPSHVYCTIEIDISSFKGPIREEWCSLKEHDVIYFVAIEKPTDMAGSKESMQKYEKERKLLSQRLKPVDVIENIPENAAIEGMHRGHDMSFREMYGVKYVRGGEVFGTFDESTEAEKEKTVKSGSFLKLRLKLDPAQYYEDIKNGLNCYDELNLIVRRKPKSNNNKAVLQTIRDVMNTSLTDSIPKWLYEIFLGYGKANSAHYRTLNCNSEEHMKYLDTFLDAQHVADSFPKSEVSFVDGSVVQPPYDLTIIPSSSEGEIEKINVSSGSDTYRRGYRTRHDIANQEVRFTSSQIEAIRSGMNEGLTMVVGPPGTGKTDVAVQLITNLYHNYPTQKIVVVAHSNAALNDIFERIRQKDVDPRHLLRLGTGEKDLVGNEDFTRVGRVNYSLACRLELLQQVQNLGQVLNVPGDVGSSCETGAYFYQEHIKPRIENFSSITKNGDSFDPDIFPFIAYFPSVKTIDQAESCISQIEKLFNELAEYRAFELLRTQRHRADYILMKQARIVAMTCTHAALTRERLVELGFKYDSLIMEEAAQMLEVETFIPMQMQSSNTMDGCRLKRVVLIGDHHQLPPVVQNMAFKKYCHFDQSMFSRLIRLGVPHIMLDQQGRARAEIAALYQWRYIEGEKYLTNLPLVESEETFLRANAGFRHTFQFIDVQNFEGRGEYSPSPYFYQNKGEAEYVVACYQYMRLIGYPAEKISIITTYNGQKNLIRDVIAQRCLNPMFGAPARVTTVDKYQGQQNDYILLSLVRTESVGHLRDIRRLIVAMSRARLGLYVFGRANLFVNCFELAPVLSQLMNTDGNKLEIVTSESYDPGVTRRSGDEKLPKDAKLHVVDDLSAMGILVYQMIQATQANLSQN